MIPRVTTHTNFLKALHVLKPKFRKALLKSCNQEELHCICECIHNVLQGKITIPTKEKNKLEKYKHILRKLISKGTNRTRKNIIIQKGGAFLPIILGAVLSALLGSVTK